MDEQEQLYLQTKEKEIEQERLRRLGAENNYASLSSTFSPNKDQNLIEYQLDLKEELDRIHHLLSGHILGRDADNNEIWIEPQDDRIKIFSEYGVKRIMNIVQFYINRNTLLSNYDATTILWKVRDFGIELADLVYCEYESFFYYPSPEELYEKYYKIVKEKNLNLTDLEIYEKCLQWSKEELQHRIRHYPMLILAIVDSVHSTYLRALGGEERESLRKILHVSQSTNPPISYQPPRQGMISKLFGARPQ